VFNTGYRILNYEEERNKFFIIFSKKKVEPLVSCLVCVRVILFETNTCRRKRESVFSLTLEKRISRQKRERASESFNTRDPFAKGTA